MRLLLDPNAWGAGYGLGPQGAPQPQPPAAPQGQYAQPGQYGPALPTGQPNPYAAPAVAGQFGQAPGFAAQGPAGAFQNPNPGATPLPAGFQVGVQGWPGYANPYQAPGTYQNPIPVQGQQLPAGFQVGPAPQPLPQYGPAPQAPAQFPQQYPGVQVGPSPQLPAGGYQFGPSQAAPPAPQPGVLATLPPAQPGQQAPAGQALNLGQVDLAREPQTFAEAQQQLNAVRIERIQALGRAGQSEQALQEMQRHYQAQIQSLQQNLGQRDQALQAATQDRVLSESLMGVTFRDQASALNCRQLIANRLEVGPDGQVRERGTGRPGPQAIQDYLRQDLAVFLAPSTQGGPPPPQGQFQNPNPPAGPLSPGEQLIQNWKQGVQAQLQVGNYPPGYQAALGAPPGFNPFGPR